MEEIGSLVGIIAGTLTIVGMLYGFNKWLKGKKKKPVLNGKFTSATDKMPKLIEEMKADLEDKPLSREFILLSKRHIYNPGPNKSVKVYFFEDHDDLTEKIGVLENLEFVHEITFNNTPRFKMTEHFVEQLTQ